MYEFSIDDVDQVLFNTDYRTLVTILSIQDTTIRASLYNIIVRVQLGKLSKPSIVFIIE